MPVDEKATEELRTQIEAFNQAERPKPLPNEYGDDEESQKRKRMYELWKKR